MFGLGMPEILLILALALIVIGPKRLPDLAKTLGKAMGEFKRATADFKNSIDLDTGIDDIKPASSSIRDNIKEAKEPGKKDRTGEDEEDSSPGNESETENTDANGSGTGTNGDEPPNGNGNEKDKTGTRAD